MVWVRVGGRGRGYGGYRPRYGGGGGGGGGCLRDLLFLDAGCCLAEALGCGPQLLVLAPAAVRLALQRPGARRGWAVGLVELYRERVSARRQRPCCRMSPSCSTYALEALHTHGTLRGLGLTAARLLRCRPGGPTGADPVPGAPGAR